MPSEITGDESARLGTIAQRDFMNLADRARLTVTSPQPDLNGLDCVLEELPSNAQHGSLDKRPAHSICRVQVKATYNTKPKVRVSLSKLDTLVKSSQPSVIAVMQCDHNEECHSFFLIHLIGDRLATALKALRRHGARAKLLANDAFWTVTARESERVAFDRTALLVAFRMITGLSTRDYADVKNLELDTLGYPKTGRFSLRGEIEGSIHEIADGFLNLKPLPVATIEAWETRFEIPMLAFKGVPGQLRVEFSPVAQGKLRVTRLSDGYQVGIEPASLSAVPLHDLPSDVNSTVIRTPLITIVTSATKCQYNFNIHPAGLLHWNSTYELHSLVRNGGVKVDFVTDEEAFSVWNGDPAPFKGDREVENAAQLVRLALDLVTEAGLADTRLVPEQVIQQQHNIRALHEIVFKYESLRINFEVDQVGADAPPEQVLLVLTTKVTSVWIGVAVGMNLTVSSDGIWHLSANRIVGVQDLKESFSTEFDRFAKNTARAANLDLVVKLKPAHFTGLEPLAGEISFGSGHVIPSIEAISTR